MNLKYIFGGVLVASAATAYGGPTGLIFMPIADVLDHRTLSYSLGAIGYEHNKNKGYDWSQEVEVGLFNRAEFGIDNDFKGGTALNAKLLLINKRVAEIDGLSVGLTNYVDGNGQFFAVVRHDFKSWRLHAGAIQGTGNHLLIGVDGQLGKATIAAEWISGCYSRGWLSYSLDLPFFPMINILAGVGIPANASGGIQHTIQISYTCRI